MKFSYRLSARWRPASSGRQPKAESRQLTMPTPFQIDIANEQSLLPVDEARLAEIAERILTDAGVRCGVLSIAVVDDATIQRLNKEFLQHDYPTDVLSFALDEDFDAFEGEVLVSAETARHNAAQFGWPPEKELALYVIHGTLHLAGYRDKTPGDQAAMREAETRYLRTLDSQEAIEGALL